MSGFLDAVASAPFILPQDLLADRPLVVLAPHPDDETLGCGALIFDAAAQGTACHVICVTDGSRSHPQSRDWPPKRLAALRHDELIRAVATLAPAARVDWLGYPDCQAPDDPASAGQIARLIPQRALLLASWAGDPHIDHKNVAQLATHIASTRPDIRLAFYPIWGRFTDLAPPCHRIHASDASLDAKARALACHRSQMTRMIADDPDGFVMEDWRQQHFLTQPEIIIAP